jgi:hypothetical protein
MCGMRSSYCLIVGTLAVLLLMTWPLRRAADLPKHVMRSLSPGV